jgi:hypothetical protein
MRWISSELPRSEPFPGWTAGQRNDFQEATLAAYWHQDTNRFDEASLDRALGTAVNDAVNRIMGTSRSSTPTPPPSGTRASGEAILRSPIPTIAIPTIVQNVIFPKDDIVTLDPYEITTDPQGSDFYTDSVWTDTSYLTNGCQVTTTYRMGTTSFTAGVFGTWGSQRTSSKAVGSVMTCNGVSYGYDGQGNYYGGVVVTEVANADYVGFMKPFKLPPLKKSSGDSADGFLRVVMDPSIGYVEDDRNATVTAYIELQKLLFSKNISVGIEIVFPNYADGRATFDYLGGVASNTDAVIHVAHYSRGQRDDRGRPIHGVGFFGSPTSRQDIEQLYKNETGISSVRGISCSPRNNLDFQGLVNDSFNFISGLFEGK